MIKEEIFFIKKIILSTFFSLSLYFLIYSPIEFLLTEVIYFSVKINSLINSFILLLLLIFSAIFNWNKIIFNKKNIILIIFIMSFSIFSGFFYSHQKKLREYLPKIYRVSPDLLIQGQIIEIKGINFGLYQGNGSVKIGENKLRVLNWYDDKILAEIPVMPQMGIFNILVEANNFKKSNQLEVEIKDPIYLEKYIK